MMRVKSGTDGKIEGKGGETGRRHTGHTVAQVQPSFGTSMDDALEEIEVRELLARLNTVTDKLSVFPAERLLVEYKLVLRELLSRALRGFSLRRDLKWRRTSRNTYVTVERAEAALSELEEVFKQESGRTRALRLMEEIKGCLISLLF